MAKAKSSVPAGLHTVTPHLIHDNTVEAIKWYKQALGAEEVAPPAIGPDGKIMHAELRIGNSIVFLNDAMGGGRSSRTIGGSPVSFFVYVDDCDALYHRAVNAGAQVPPGPMGALGDQFWGDRCGTIFDPYGYGWTLATRKEDLTPEEVKTRMDAFFKQFACQATAEHAELAETN